MHAHIHRWVEGRAALQREGGAALVLACSQPQITHHRRMEPHLAGSNSGWEQDWPTEGSGRQIPNMRGCAAA